MRPQSSARAHTGGRHELGQNFLIHRPTLDQMAELVRRTSGPILEIGGGNGALTARLATLGRDLRVIDIDPRLVSQLRVRFPKASVAQADALREPLNRAVIVGNVPFHLTTPILRRLLREGSWQDAVLLTQWEVARKRAGIGGATMMTAQAAPWFTFHLHDRTPARGFRPMPSVDGGILSIQRRADPLVPLHQRKRYDAFVAAVFRGRGNGIRQILQRMSLPASAIDRALRVTALAPRALPRDIAPAQWAHLWSALTPI